MTGDHNIDTDSSLESFISFGNLYKLTPPTSSIGFAAVNSYKSPHHCPTEMMVELVNQNNPAASKLFSICNGTVTPYMMSYVCECSVDF